MRKLLWLDICFLLKPISFIASAYCFADFSFEFYGGSFVLAKLIAGLVLAILYYCVFSEGVKGAVKKSFTTLIDEKIGIDPKDPEMYEKYDRRTNKFLSMKNNKEKIYDIIANSETQEEFDRKLKYLGYYDFMIEEAKAEGDYKE